MSSLFVGRPPQGPCGGLRRTVAAFEARGIPHAVVGGHAVAAWVARIDPATLALLPEALRPRLAQLLANPDG